MNRISSGQLTTALLLSNAFMLMCVSVPMGIESMLGAIIAFVIQTALCVPMLLLYRNGFSLSAYCQQKHRLIPLLFVLYFIIRGGISFLLLWNGSEHLSLPFTQPLITAVMIGLVCLYTASLGLRAFTRAGTIIFGFFVFSLAILLLGAWQRMDFQQLSPSEDSTVLGSAMQILSLADTLPALFILLGFTENKKAGKTLRFLGGSLILWEIILFLCITVLGALLPTAKNPFFMLTSVSQPLTTQRADAFYLIVFVMLCVIRLTLLTVLSAHLLGMLFPRLRYRSILSLGGMIGAAAAFSAIGFMGNRYCIIGIVFFTCAVPLILYFCLKRNPSWKEETAS